MKRLMSLWGKGAKAEDEPKDETDEEKTAREQAEKEEADRKAEEDRKAKEAAASDEEDEDDEDEEDEATKAAAAAVPANVRASIARSAVRAERSRIHAIVDGGGRDRVETSLQLALGTNLTAKAALAIVATTAGPASSATVPAGGRLGLAGDMATRPPRQLGPAAAPAGGPATEVDKAAASILKHVSKAA